MPTHYLLKSSLNQVYPPRSTLNTNQQLDQSQSSNLSPGPPSNLSSFICSDLFISPLPTLMACFLGLYIQEGDIKKYYCRVIFTLSKIDRLAPDSKYHLKTWLFFGWVILTPSNKRFHIATKVPWWQAYSFLFLYRIWLELLIQSLKFSPYL